MMLISPVLVLVILQAQLMSTMPIDAVEAEGPAASQPAAPEDRSRVIRSPQTGWFPFFQPVEPGQVGKPGVPGRPGKPGKPGRPGKPGKPGIIPGTFTPHTPPGNFGRPGNFGAPSSFTPPKLPFAPTFHIPNPPNPGNPGNPGNPSGPGK